MCDSVTQSSTGFGRTRRRIGLRESARIRIFSLVRRGTVPVDMPKQRRRGAPAGAAAGSKGALGARRRAPVDPVKKIARTG